MNIVSTYKVKITESNKCFDDTAKLYRRAVDYFIKVCLAEWNTIQSIKGAKSRLNFIEIHTITTKTHPNPKYKFSTKFYKFPSYLRRAAIAEAIGKVSSYKSNLQNWIDKGKKGNAPSCPIAGYVYPAMYKDGSYVRIDNNTAKLKVWRFNTWDWITVKLNNSDVNYILKHCIGRTECVPTLQRKGKNWYLAFPFEEQVKLSKIDVQSQIVLGVDLGVNNACVCSAMKSDGTIIGRKFLSLPKEQDSLKHTLNRIKKLQQHGAHKCPKLWAKAKGINKDISAKTAQFIIDVAWLYHADVIVFEHLNKKGKKHNQKIHHWKSQEVQKMVEHKAHRQGVRIRRVCAKNTSRLAYDGSGVVTRHKNNHSICTFKSGKIYHCDLSASYNIASRYFVREFLKSDSVRKRLGTKANDPLYTKRTTCTLSVLISLNADMTASPSSI